MKSIKEQLTNLGIVTTKQIYSNLSPSKLIEESILLGMGKLTNTGALAINTGEFTGRSPKDRFIVNDDITSNNVFWNDINLPFDKDKFDSLYNKMIKYVSDKNLYVKDVYACADKSHHLNVRLIAEYPWSALFVDNMFNRFSEEELCTFKSDWTVLCVPSFKADPLVDGTRQHNFAIINFTKQQIIIGGTAYTGEIKKGIFSVLNYILPQNHQILSMHCSVNEGEKGDSAVFFGLSGTGKTTLSTSPDRYLIGDDEHAWDDEEVFNFEGGCYAKVIDLTEDSEPEIFRAIKYGSLLENVVFDEANRIVDFHDSSITVNTRVSYPINFIPNAKTPSVTSLPKNVFFLTCDAFGVLPPISKLSKSQAMYHFISGYTAKVAGTEEGINEPQAVFSACFGEPFMPLHPQKYADLLGDKMEKQHVNVWLINTGWSKGPYGIGNRIKLKYTRAMIKAALEGKLDSVDFEIMPIFNFNIPVTCPDVPQEILNPKSTWSDSVMYDEKLNKLAGLFINNFNKYRAKSNSDILEGEPKL